MSSATWALHETSQRTERLAKGKHGGVTVLTSNSLCILASRTLPVTDRRSRGILPIRPYLGVDKEDTPGTHQFVSYL